MRLALLLLALILLPLDSAAAQGADVRIVEVQKPDQTVAGHVFPVNVTVQNDGDARRVYLFAALYDGLSDPAAPCGAATSARFRTYTPLVQAALDLPARGRTTYPAAGDKWEHRYDADDAPAAPSENEWCVFVAESDQPPRLDYLDFDSLKLATRRTNAAPTADFTWTPASPRATEDVRFEATGADADSDPLVFTWDFGHANASGRARATGSTPTHFFFPEDTFTVTLTVSDGFTETRIVRDIAVRPTSAPTDPAPSTVTRDANTPVPVALMLAVPIVALALRRRPRG